MIRPVRDQDADSIIALIGGCWAEYPGCIMDVDGENPELRAFASHARAKNGIALGAEQDGALVGIVAAWPINHDGAWEIARMYVAPSMHGAGLARTLLHTAEAHARQAGAERLVLWTDTRFTRAHGFYEKHGYVRHGPIRILDDISHSLEFRYAKPAAGLVVEALDAAAAVSAERCLAELLVACVDEGASVSFLPPLSRERALAFWKTGSAGVAAGERILLAAWLDGALLGSVTVNLAMQENQPHTAEIQKLMVSPAARRQGIGRALLRRAEQAARGHGRRMVLLDTRAGSAAEALYRSENWQELGRIPGFELDGARRPCDTSFFWKAF